MKKRILSLLCAAALVAGLSAPAMAAETPAIRVQLDGENLTFTDAVPTAKDGRTYLPARVVLEALGTTVTADAAAGTVTAVRGGKTLVMTIGSTEATVTEDGVSSTVTMDAAPYVEGNRTYVPVRFAAQAFNCAVGWDGSKQTVVLVDAAKLAETAIKNNSYTLLEKVSTLGEKYSTGNWAMDGTMSMDMGGMGVDKLITASGTVKGITSGQTAAQMNMDMKMDMTGLYSLISSMGGTAAQQPAPSDLKMNLSTDMRMDLTTGKYYFKFAGLPADAGFPANAWISMNMDELLAQSGLNFDMETLLQSQKLNPADLVSLALSHMNVDDSATGYGMCAILAQSAASLFADEAFEKTATGYVNKIDFSENGTTLNLTITLTTNAKGDLTGYQVDGGIAVDVKTMAAQPGGESLKQSLDSLTAMGLNMDNLTLSLNIGMEQNGTSNAKLSMVLGSIANFSVKADSKMTSTTKKPELTPPAGATVVDWMDFIGTTLPTK